jgi:hypothetical protein
MRRLGNTAVTSSEYQNLEKSQRTPDCGFSVAAESTRGQEKANNIRTGIAEWAEGTMQSPVITPAVDETSLGPVRG